MKRIVISVLASALCIGFCTTGFAQDKPAPQYAVVNLSACFLRLHPDYESPLESQELMGTVVEITDESGYWKKIVSNQLYSAWCNRLALVEMSAEEIDEYRSAPKYMCVAWHSTVYSEPSETSLKLSDLVEGDVLRQVFSGVDDGDASARRGRGSGGKNKPLVRRGFRVVRLADGRQGFVPKNDLQDYDEWVASRQPTAENIITEALKFNGIPYLWGGVSPNGVDCSGLVRYCFLMNGVALPRNSSQQARVGKEIPVNGLSVTEFRPADLLFFGSVDEDGTRHISHVAMYIGDGKIIHAAQVVRVNSLNPDEPDYYEGAHRLVAARRILTE